MKNAGNIVSSALRVVGPPIGSVLLDEVKLWSSLRDDMKTLEQTKILLQWQMSNLEDIHLERWLNGPVQGADRYLFQCVNEMIKTLKFVIHDIEDVLWYYSERSKRKSYAEKVSSLFTKSNPMFTRFTLVRKVNDVISELKRVQDLFLPVESLMNPAARQTIQYSRTSSEVIGRDEDFNTIMDLLAKSDYDETVIVVLVAPSGFGKTSIVKQLYSDSRIKDNFKRIWIDLSTCTVDPERIGQEIILKSSKDIDSDLLMKDQLKNVLHNDNCFIVLDGLLGDHQQIAQLKEMLTAGRGAQSRVVVTTYSQKVAKMIATVDPYRLHAVSPDVCRSIIQKATRCEDNDQLFVEHLDGITTRCNGMPLVAEFIGSVLATGPEIPELWKLAKDQELWKVEFDFCSVPPLLQNYRLIYYRMPRDMRLCFVYCCIFSNVSGVKRQHLTKQWLVLDMIETDHNTLPLEVIADQYVEEMKSLFLIEASEPTALETFHLNYLSYELARSVGSQEIIVLSETSNVADRYCDYRFLQLSTGILSSIKRKNWPVKARSLVLRSTDAELKLLKQVISVNQFLRVLDLRECSIKEIPQCVFHLNQLRYLDASGLPITQFLLPRNKLQNLDTLDLSDTRLECLPDCISDLGVLRFLSLRGCEQLRCLPERFGSFENLQYLDLANCISLQEVPRSFDLLRTINHLDISGCLFGDGAALSSELNTENASRRAGDSIDLNADRTGIAPITAVSDSIGGSTELKTVEGSVPSTAVATDHKEIEECENQNPRRKVVDLSCELSSDSTSEVHLSDASQGAGLPNTAVYAKQENPQKRSIMQKIRHLVNQHHLPYQIQEGMKSGSLSKNEEQLAQDSLLKEKWRLAHCSEI